MKCFLVMLFLTMLACSTSVAHLVHFISKIQCESGKFPVNKKIRWFIVWRNLKIKLFSFVLYAHFHFFFLTFFLSFWLWLVTLDRYCSSITSADMQTLINELCLSELQFKGKVLWFACDNLVSLFESALFCRNTTFTFSACFNRLL